jgi:hypothetical protein
LASPKATCGGLSTDPVLRADEVVAGVHVAVVLQRHRTAAGLGVDADAQIGHVEPVGQGGVEHLHEDLADVAPHPLVEHVDQEPAVVDAGDRLRADPVGGRFHDRDELKEPGA